MSHVASALSRQPEAAEEPAQAVAAAPAAEPAPAPAAPPAFVPMPPWRAAIYASASVLLGLTQGLGLNLVSANITSAQGSLGATQIEANWLIAAYMATNITGTMVIYKIRTQFGLRRFAEIGLIAYTLVTIAHLFTRDLQSAIAVRAVMGIAAAPLSTLAFFYMLEWLPPSRKLTVGVCLGLLGAQMATPLARVISPELLQLGDWHGLYLFETGLALMCLAVIYLLPITQLPRLKIFDREDFLSFPLIAIGFGSLAVVLTMGRLYWWFDTPWVGTLLAISVGALALLAVVELHRVHPAIDLRWLSTYDMLALAGSLFIFRFLLSEQTVGVVGILTVLGMQNDQMIPLFWVILIVTVIGYLFTAAVMTPTNGNQLHFLALVLIAIASWRDSHSTNLTRPEDFYITQSMMAFAGALFLPPALLTGFGQALKRGPMFVLSFLVIFLGTQSLGGILCSAILGTFQTIREKFHSSVLTDQLTLLNPLVAQRVQTYAGAYAKVLPDGSLRNAEGVVMLGKAATQEANVLAYNDMFLLIFVASILTMAGLLMHTTYVTIRQNRQKAAASA